MNPQQPPEDDVPDAEEDESYPLALSAIDSAPDVDVCDTQHLITSYETN